jgi:hypothetical protein
MRPISIAHPRNRIRHEVMPELRAINAQADAALARAAEILRGDDEFLETLANAAFLRRVERRWDGDGHGWTARVFEAAAVAGAAVARYALETANPPHVWVRGVGRAAARRRGRDRREPSGSALERFGANAVLVIRRWNGRSRCLPLIP